MGKRCPPGVLCIENITLVTGMIILCGIVYFINESGKRKRCAGGCAKRHRHVHGHAFHFPRAPPFHDSLRHEIENSRSDVLRDPYEPPLRNSMAINIPTQSINASYRQVGILTNGNNIIPLMGRPLFTNRDKWNFYTMTDKSNMIKLPIVYQGKNCTSEHGCQNIYSNDEVHVEGYNETFKATMYENDVLRYIPHL
jgi:hypothetical protein